MQLILGTLEVEDTDIFHFEEKSGLRLDLFLEETVSLIGHLVLVFLAAFLGVEIDGHLNVGLTSPPVPRWASMFSNDRSRTNCVSVSS